MRILAYEVLSSSASRGIVFLNTNDTAYVCNDTFSELEDEMSKE